MLRSVKELEGYALQAADGAIGHVQDFYFDDEMWGVRYLVADTGRWLTGRRVLISPLALGDPNWREQRLPVSLTKDQIRESPDIDTDRPVSRQHEASYFNYYGYPYYWAGPGLWGVAAYPRVERQRDENRPAGTQPFEESHDTHLRSCRTVTGYHVEASDGPLGHVQDFLLDDEAWALRYLVIDTSNWWGGKKVLLSPDWIDHMSWSDSKVFMMLTRESINGATPYDPSNVFNRESEERLYAHYGRSGYWLQEPGASREASMSGVTAGQGVSGSRSPERR